VFTAIIFILVLGILVFVHELGHFLVARRNGVGVEEFGFGFPPRIAGIYWNEEGKKKIVWGSRNAKTKDTIYSVNWIPLGGFVKILGEEGEAKDNPKSFSSKTALARVRILAAGVAMNFVLAAVLLSVGYFIGIPQLVEETSGGILKNEKVQIIEVAANSPAEEMGIKMGDEIVSAVDQWGNQVTKFESVEDVQNFISGKKGQEITLNLKRGKEEMKVTGVPRADHPSDQGALGIGLAEVAEVSYSWYEAVWLGIKTTFDLTVAIIFAFGNILAKLATGQSVSSDVAGPVGIAVLTGQVAKLGLVYILQFTAILSINLAIINILPIPALDGGRILFILIEKIKGSPLSQKIEQRAHNIGFAVLITFMIFITFRDFVKFDVIEKIKGLF